MSAHGYSNNKDNLVKRLNRAEGQIRGIRRMVEADTYCIDVLTQINAAQAALDKVAVELLRDHAQHCMAQATTADERVDKANEIVGAVSRMLSR